MRLGGNVFGDFKNGQEWAQANVDMGYKAVYFPVNYTDDVKKIDEYVEAAKEKDLVIAEVGIWDNMISLDENIRKNAMEKSIKKLELADYIKAKCCVNVSGSSAQFWYGPHIDNYSEETFDKVCKSIQSIIDTVKPKNTHFALEPMPWLYPDNADDYLKLIKHIDREAFGVHIDMVNVIYTPYNYFYNKEIIKEWFDKLSPYIKSCHVKDTIISNKLTLTLSECRPGTGNMDHEYWIKRMNELDKDTPFMLEHMSDPNDFVEAVKYLKAVAKNIGITL